MRRAYRRAPTGTPSNAVSGIPTGVNSHILSHLTLGTGLGQSSKQGKNARLKRSMVNFTSPNADLTFGGIWDLKDFNEQLTNSS